MLLCRAHARSHKDARLRVLIGDAEYARRLRAVVAAAADDDPGDAAADAPRCCRCVTPGVLAPLAEPKLPGYAYTDPSTCTGAELRRSYATGRAYWPRDPATCSDAHFPGHAWLVRRGIVPLGWAEDYAWFQRQHHPLLSLALAHPRHALKWHKVMMRRASSPPLSGGEGCVS